MPPHPPKAKSGATAVEVARRCAAAASALIHRSFGTAEVAAVKGPRDVVTEVDLLAEAAVLEILGSEYPDHTVLSEETRAETASDGWLWVVDPIDGTKNYSRSIPHFAFSIALCVGGEPVLGLTQHPLLNEEYLAVRGQGVTLNGFPVVRTPALSLQDAVVGLDLGYAAASGAAQLRLASSLWPNVQGIRVVGSAALGYAFFAAGRWDVYLHRNLKPWDIAAGLVLTREAGGQTVEPDGRPATFRSTEVLAAEPPLLDAMLRLISGMRD